MKIKADLLHIAHIPGVDAEVQPVQHVQIGVAPVTGQKSGDLLGGMRTQIIKDTTAGVEAQRVRSFCSSCKHFDNKRWLLLKKAWEHGTIEQKNFVQGFRALLLETRNAKFEAMHSGEDGLEVEHALAYLGVCQAVTEVQQQPVVVHPLSHCPDAFVTPASPQGLFEQADRSTERASSAAYDEIMLRAEGKKA